MPLKLSCPHCQSPTRFTEPFPQPGTEVQCPACGQTMSVTYPNGVVQMLRDRGKRFVDDAVPAASLRTRAELSRVPTAPPIPPPSRRARATGPESGTVAPTTVDRTSVDATRVQDEGAAEPPSFAELDRTVASSRTPDGGLPGQIGEPEADADVGASASDPTVRLGEPEARPMPAAGKRSSRIAGKPANGGPGEPGRRSRKSGGKAEVKPKSRWRWVRRAGCLGIGAVVLLACAGGGGLMFGDDVLWWYYADELPTMEFLQTYTPATVTVVTDHKGEVMGELYGEERRYVLPLEEIPKTVQDAFLAAEDASFWEHGGVDYMGLVRAVLNEAGGGDKSQGASTITMQVTRGFLLTREKTYERKIKEILLSWQLEDTYSKEHILYLYLNEIYLGSGAYGVEAASRVYFGKHVNELSLGEAALIAGLPPAPSTYSPHKNWETARNRQVYVLKQMVALGLITQAEADAAKAEELKIIKEDNPFLTMSPYFTEHVRRYLLDTYGFDKVYKEGLQVITTCDLEKQRAAQKAVIEGVKRNSDHIGFRRTRPPGEGAKPEDPWVPIETLADDAAIAARRTVHADAIKEAWRRALDPAGRIAAPEQSPIEEGGRYDAVVLEVAKTWVRVGVGEAEGVIPIAWSSWVDKPNEWRSPKQTDFTKPVRMDWEDKAVGGILRKGDVVQVDVKALSTRKDADLAKVFRKTPGADADLLALELYQQPEIESGLLSFDLATGAVRAMVGGADFTKSELNRPIQSRRQVGSTFKPVVYSAAIDNETVTTATMLVDGPLALSTDQEFVWKPGNYGGDYLGNISLRKALQMSRNTCTVRVLEAMDPGMNNDVLYTFTRRLGIGGPPLHTLPDDYVALPTNTHLCPWVRETRDSTICMDRYPPKDPNISNTRHRQLLKDDDVYMCRACDFSLGLGSGALTMEELMRAYTAFPTGGHLIEPYYVEEVRDRDGNVLEKHQVEEFPQVIDPAVASIGTWLLEAVVNGGTGYEARKELHYNLGGKTGTTNDHLDTWFIGFSPDIITAVWVGYDQPRNLGAWATGGRAALPIWIDYMRVALDPKKDRPFERHGDLEWANIDPDTGRVVTSGGMRFPFLKGTVPESSGVAAGQLTIDDIGTEL